MEDRRDRTRSSKPSTARPGGRTARTGRPPGARTRARAGAILKTLDAEYPDSRCSLDHANAFQLLIATILSAQCTDARVNIVTKDLFAAAPDPESLAAMPLARIEDLIRTTGFFRNKAKHIQGAARRIVEDFDGQVPVEMEDLLSLPGVARKTANVVRGTAYGLATGIVVDTHVARIARLLGLTAHKDPVKIERDLMALIPPEHWIRFTHQVIDHGRRVCIAGRPRCDACCLAPVCPHAAKPGRARP